MLPLVLVTFRRPSNGRVVLELKWMDKMSEVLRARSCVPCAE